jgi:hypothetical protein
MKKKWTLFTGIILLIVGIIIRKSTGLSMEGLVIILIGVLFKSYYIISKIKSGEYRPGYEIAFLFAGLVLFLTGLYLRAHNPPFNPVFLIVPGISLKVVFILLFIVKTRSSRTS